MLKIQVHLHQDHIKMYFSGHHSIFVRNCLCIAIVTASQLFLKLSGFVTYPLINVTTMSEMKNVK